ncbi:MAG: hypothetical protein DSZ29_00615 [Aquificaceae bacterium]|nr:MAG: hypothetical protein DSZ29_00615 [Aquificaceae bacterium]
MPLPFSVQFLPVENISALDADENILAAIRYASIASKENTKKPLFSVGLPNLALSNVVEVWYSDEPVQTSSMNGLQLAYNDDILFGHLLLDETNYEDIDLASKDAYRLVLETIHSLGYPYILRIWNYFSSINEDQQGLERYKKFCLGRQQTLDQFGSFAYSPPAATAIGTSCGGLQVYFIAAKEPGIQLENPRQTSAFLYPPQYGSASPAFSRATVKKWQDTTHLYISGTASIVGHETRHIGQVLKQLEETLENIEALVQHGAETQDLPIHHLTDLSYLKVYLRDLFMLSITEELLIRRYGRHLPMVLFLHGDVCRADLLVEIEAAYILNDDM